MKFCVTPEHTFQDIEPYLAPVRQFGEEKLRKGMYDDWNEAAHTADWIKKILSAMQNVQNGTLTVYYLEENGQIIGSAFALINSTITRDALAKDGVVPGSDPIAHVTCFHILEAYRGKGRGSFWLTHEIFDDLRRRDVKEVYIKSSHNPALPLYEKLGTKVGNYISISDSNLYQRYGYIYKIEL